MFYCLGASIMIYYNTCFRVFQIVLRGRGDSTPSGEGRGDFARRFIGWWESDEESF